MLNVKFKVRDGRNSLSRPSSRTSQRSSSPSNVRTQRSRSADRTKITKITKNGQTITTVVDGKLSYGNTNNQFNKKKHTQRLFYPHTRVAVHMQYGAMKCVPPQSVAWQWNGRLLYAIRFNVNSIIIILIKFRSNKMYCVRWARPICKWKTQCLHHQTTIWRFENRLTDSCFCCKGKYDEFLYVK